MYLRKINIRKNGKNHPYWALVESYRTANGPRQRVVSYLGEMDAEGRIGIKNAVEGRLDYQEDLFENQEPEWIEVNVHGIRTERVRDFGDIWLAFQLIRRLGLYDFFKSAIPSDRAILSWADLACVLIISRHPAPLDRSTLNLHILV